MVSAWMGKETTLSLCAVVILAVVDRPGRSSSEGASSVTTTLKSLASSVPVVDCDVAYAAGAQQSLVSNQRHMALEDLARDGVDGHVGGLAKLHIDDIGLVHLHFRGDHAHVGQRHQGRAGRVLNAGDHRFAFLDRHVGDDTVKRRDRDGFVEHVLIGAKGGNLGLQMAARGFSLRLGLVKLGHHLRDRRDVGVVRGLLAVEVLLGHDSGLVKTLGAIPVQLFLLQVSLGALHIRLGGLLGGDVGIDVGLGGRDGSFLPGDICLLLHIFDLSLPSGPS